MTRIAAFVVLLVPLIFVGLKSAEAGQRYYTVGAAGYDTVAYFTENEAKRGIRAFSVEHESVTFLFSSEENRDLFKEEPTKYIPQYLGWCAYAMAYDAYVRGDPEYWAIVDGRLYFNDHGAQGLWQAGTTKLIADADKFWASEAGS